MAPAQFETVLHSIRDMTGRLPASQALDHELLQRFVDGNEQAAFAALVYRHGPLVLGVCRRILHHDQDAEDAFQATFLVLARKASTLRWSGSIVGWLFAVAARVATAQRCDCCG